MRHISASICGISFMIKFKKIKLTERIEHKPNFISQGNFSKFFEDWLIRQFKFIESLKNNKLLKMWSYIFIEMQIIFS